MTLPMIPNDENGQPLTPDQANYTTVRSQDAIVATKLSGGRSAYRRDRLGSSSFVTVTWTYSSAAHAILDNFFMVTLAEGSLPFTAYLSIDSAALTLYKCNFVPNTFGTQTIEGDTYTDGAQLEVTLA